MTRRRVGVLGGTFDPIHHGHLFSAAAAAAAVGLERVLLVPAAQSPFKPQAMAPATDRLAMARLVAAEDPLLEVSTVDLDRPPPSYTVDTLATLAARQPETDWYLILGTDALQELLEWREPERLLDLCRVVAVSRPGYPLELPLAAAARLGPRVARITLVRMPLLEISSTDLRRRLAQGEPVRYLLPASVERYIRARGLYGACRTPWQSPA